jgi:hypothetical protein
MPQWPELFYYMIFMKLNDKWIFSAIVLALCCFAQLSNAQALQQDTSGGFVTEPQQYVVPANKIRVIRVIADEILSGEISVIAVNEQKYSLQLTKEFHVTNRTTAGKYADYILTTFAPKQDTVELRLSVTKPVPWSNDTSSVRITIELTVPKQCNLVVDAPLFSLSAEGPLTSVINTTSQREMEIFSVDGKIDVRGAGGMVSVEQISGEISVANEQGKLEGRDIVCRSGSAQFRNEGGDIYLENVTGAIALKSVSGKVEISGFQPSTTERSYIANSQGPILLELKHINAGDIAINNRDDDIELRIPTTLSAMLSLTVDQSSRIEVSNLQTIPELVLPNRLGLRMKEGNVQLNSSARGSGNIFVRGVESED